MDGHDYNPCDELEERYWNGDESVGYIQEGTFYPFDNFDEDAFFYRSIKAGIKTRTRNCLIKHGVKEDTKIRIDGTSLKGLDEILVYALKMPAPRFHLYYHIDLSNERKAKLASKLKKKVS